MSDSSIPSSHSNPNSNSNSNPDAVYRPTPGQPPSEAVVLAVAAVSGRSIVPEERDDRLEDDAGTADASAGADAEPLEPLYDAIDPDALNALFRSTDAERSARGRVSFCYCGCAVTVDDAGRVTVSSPEERANEEGEPKENAEDRSNAAETGTEGDR